MNDTSTVERQAKKTAGAIEALWKPTQADFDVVSRLRVFLEEDRATRIQIDAPAAQAEACSPVPATVSWTRPATPGSFQARLDGQDITGRFRVDEAAMRATATLDLDGGVDHTLAAGVEMFRWLPKPGHRRMEAQTTFHVLAPRWNLGLTGTMGSDGMTVVDVLPGRSPIRVAITPTQCTPPDLVIKAFTAFYAADEVPGISFEIPFTIPKGSSHGFLYVNVAASVPAGLHWAFVIAQTPKDLPVGAASSFVGFYLNVLPH